MTVPVASRRLAWASETSESKLALLVGDAVDFADEDELVGVQRDRRGRGDVLHHQVEGIAGGGVADVGQEHDEAVVQRQPDHLRIHLAHQAAVDEVDAVDDADRPRQHEIAGDHAHAGVGHRRVRQALREAGLHVEADLAGCFLGAFERHLVGDPHVLVVARLLAAQAQLLVDLRPAAVDDDDAHAHRVQQAQVLDQRVDAAADDHLAGYADDEGLAAKAVDVGRDPSQPGDELVVRQRCGRCGDRRVRSLQRCGRGGIRRRVRDRAATGAGRRIGVVHVSVIIILS